MIKNIALDGPAGAGKSTIAKLIAKKLNYIYVDTGAMYRAMALFMLRRGVDINDEKAIIDAAKEAEIEIRYEDGVQCVILNGENVNDYIRTEEVSNAASKTSVVREVRERLVALQQSLAAKENVVMDGRDIGTKVLPDAYLKVFMTASADVRAKRRYDENISKGMECDLEQIKQEIIERDNRDTTRKESPLVKAWDAVELDTSEMSIEQVVEKIISMM
ncbi:MAG: (d)CMP kinase [Lachnospiraceae bacterium]|nr:(d)CMP kinase [Lachnospiraceae bacterium]